MTLDGQVALVTGGTRGIGRAITERLSRDGAKVLALYRENDAAAEELRAFSQTDGKRIDVFRANVFDTQAVRAAVEELRST